LAGNRVMVELTIISPGLVDSYNYDKPAVIRIRTMTRRLKLSTCVAHSAIRVILSLRSFLVSGETVRPGPQYPIPFSCTYDALSCQNSGILDSII